MSVIWRDENLGIERVCDILKDNGRTCDLLLPERNVLLESLYYTVENDMSELKKGDKLYYYKNLEYLEAELVKIDHNSSSAQIRLIEKDVDKRYLFYPK